eukprot:scaffold1363_cov356-Prasinococcus_capsulatus_cf.AAC.3
MRNIADALERVRKLIQQKALGCYKDEIEKVPPLVLAAVYSLQVCEKVNVYGSVLEDANMYNNGIKPEDKRQKRRSDREVGNPLLPAKGKL